MNDDMSQFLGVFLDEADEQIGLLERDILCLEQEASPQLLQEIFRAAHTLKGSSRAMGFASMGELTHAMEDVFDKLRQGELTVSSLLINALFAGLDTLKAMKDEIAAKGATTIETMAQTARLRAVLESPLAGAARRASAEEAPGSAPSSGETRQITIAEENSAPTWDMPEGGEEVPKPQFRTLLTETARMAAQDARGAGCALYGLKVLVTTDCMMKSVRAMMVLQTLEQFGSILATTPDEEALENEQFDDEFEVILASQTERETLRGMVRGISEIRDVQVVVWNEADWTATASAVETQYAAPVSGIEPSVYSSGRPACPAETTAGTPITPEPPDARRREDRRRADAGPEARGKSPDEVEKIAAARAAPNTQAQTVRVDVARLDKLLNLVGELVIDRTRVAQLGSQLEQKLESSPLIESLNEATNHIGRITDELQEEIMKARMLPIDNVFNRFPRMVRDLAQKLGKEINFQIEGRETELDRSVIEAIGDPLIHMLRNSVDHGIETPEAREAVGKLRAGTVWLRARHEENHIVIEIQDDGRGIDPERLRAKATASGHLSQEAAARLTDREAIHLIFDSGFSTASEVTDVSGRGVGMDIVRSNLQKLGATIEIESRVGVGATFTVKLPLTLAIIRALMVTVRDSVYALPLSSVIETIKIEVSSIHRVNHREVILQRGLTLPIVRLRDVFTVNRPAYPSGRDLNRPRAEAIELSQEAVVHTAATQASIPSLYIVVVGLGNKQVGLVVDSLLGEQEVVIKTLGHFIGDIKGISGATILGDGRVALIVDVNGLITIATEEKVRAYAA